MIEDTKILESIKRNGESWVKGSEYLLLHKENELLKRKLRDAIEERDLYIRLFSKSDEQANEIISLYENKVY